MYCLLGARVALRADEISLHKKTEKFRRVRGQNTAVQNAGKIPANNKRAPFCSAGALAMQAGEKPFKKFNGATA